MDVDHSALSGRMTHHLKYVTSPFLSKKIWERVQN